MSMDSIINDDFVKDVSNSENTASKTEYDINTLIYELIQYGKMNEIIKPDDNIYYVNKLMAFFRLDDYHMPDDTVEIRDLHFILEDMTQYALDVGLIDNDSQTYRDLFDTAIIGIITPPPSVVRAKFARKYQESPLAATDFYYSFSQATNYIRTDRIKKDEKWVTTTEFGDLDITINLSKPEKDPKEIEAQSKAKKSGYPACLLCMENEGYPGNLNHPARQNHRIIPLSLDGERYFLQYSPYVYYNEHCIVFNELHIPMVINKSTFRKLLSFVQLFPHYTIGSNADLPIVGGSILSHDHFQGGGYEFPMVRAPFEMKFVIPGFEDIKAGIIKWPLSTIRLQSNDMNRITELADHILNKWKNYTDESAFIFAETDGIPHNTITPIARIRYLSAGNAVYELDLVLRNNITTEEHPLGVFHPHAEYHHIKKENIGLIEVMGLAVLPSRLKKEMNLLEDAIMAGKDIEQIRQIDELAPHADWAKDIVTKYDDIISDANISEEQKKNNLHKIIQDEIGYVFSGVLKDAGVFKCTPEGTKAFVKFIETLKI